MQALHAPGGVPTVGAPATNNNGAYTVSWTAVGEATSYEVEESANGGGWSSLYSGGAGSVAVSGRGTDGTRPPRFDIEVSWSAVSGATYYELQQNTAVVYSGPNTSWYGVGTTGKSYSVRACNASGCSAWKGPLVL